MLLHLGVLVVLVALLALTATHLSQSSDDQTPVLLGVNTFVKLGDRVAFQFTVFNEEPVATMYVYYFYVNDELLSSRNLYVQGGDRSQYGVTFTPESLGNAEVRFVLYRLGSSEPIEESVYLVDVSDSRR